MLKRILSVFMAFLMGFAVSACSKTPEKEPVEHGKTEEATTENNNVINPLTGEKTLSPAAVGKRPMAVVVQNSEACRPQWGMCSPDIIIEGLAEGGVTRMLWLYSDVNEIPKVGSIRSARMDFLEMAEGFDAIFVHCGQSQTAAAAINARHIDTINGGVWLGKYLKRDEQRLREVSSEHTVYTTGKMLGKCLSEQNYRTEKKKGYDNILSFNTEGNPERYDGGLCSSLRISYSGGYTYTFEYRESDGKYYNNIGFKTTKPFVEYGGKQESFENVIILYIPSYKVINEKGSVDMDLSGGTGLIVSNGTYEEILWKKGNTPSNTLKLYKKNGDELKLNAGQSYLGLLPRDRSGSTVIK